MATAVDKDLADRGPLKHVAWTDPMGVRLPDVRYQLPESTCGECGERVHFWINRLRAHAVATGELCVMPLCITCLLKSDIKPTRKEAAIINDAVQLLWGKLGEHSDECHGQSHMEM